MTRVSDRPAPPRPTFQQALQREFAGRDIPPYEVKGPSNGQPSKGTIIAIHGGAWVWTGAQYLRAEDADVERWRARGWSTVNIDYRGGMDSIPDVIDFYDAVRASRSPNKPVGTIGSSAGGHLALMIAAKRHPDFTISQGGPTDLNTLPPDFRANVAFLVGGEANLLRYSPVSYADSISGQVLVAGAKADPVVPIGQAREMKRARPDDTTKLELDAGDTPFIHANVDAADYQQFLGEERAMARAAIRARSN